MSDAPDQLRCAADGWRLIDDRAGTIVAGRYEVQDFLGVGAAGTVWEAIDLLAEGGRVALKVLPAKNLGEAQRFERGARLVAGLSHAHIAATLAYGKDGDGEDALHWVVMELLDGETLAHAQTRAKVFDAATALGHVGAILLGLEHAHASGIVHRDLKPSNVFITADGTAKILDFGIAKQAGASNERALADGASDDSDDLEAEVTGQFKICGTPEYMPPEQILGTPADVRSDLYAVGVMLYKLVSGAVPFRSRSRTEIYRQHLHVAPAPLAASAALPQSFIDVIMKAMAKRADDRFASARELHDALRVALGLPRLAPPPEARAPRPLFESAVPEPTPGPAVLPLGRPKTITRRAAVVFFCVSLVALLTVLASKLVEASDPASSASTSAVSEPCPAGTAAK